MKIKLFVLSFFCISCQHTSLFSKKERFFKQWVINTLSESFLDNRVFQNTPSILTSNLIIQGNSLYGVRAYNRFNGNLQWVFPVMGGVEGGIHQEKNRIFFGGSDGFFYCLEIFTGRVLWKFYSGSENLGSPMISEGVVYFITSHEKLYALNARTGKTLWVYVHPKTTQKTALNIRGVSRPAVDQQKVYAGFGDGSFLALSKNTGKVIWKTSLSKKTSVLKDIDSHPLVIGNLIYTTGYNSGLFCLNKTSGKVIWKNPEGAYSNPTIGGKTLYYATVDKQMIALNRFSGRKKWSKNLKSLATQPIIYKSTLIFGLSKGGLVLVSKSNGKQKAQVNLFRGITTRPTIDSETNELFVMSNEFWLYKFDLLF